jgi:hypothetical protein
MAYTKNTWYDRNVQYPSRYTKTDIDSDTVELTPEPGTVTNAGTSITAAKMNNLETGVDDAHTSIENMWERIGTANLSSAAGQVDFTSISSAYKYLKLTFAANSNTGSVGNISIRFNDDSGSNYYTFTNVEYNGTGIDLYKAIASSTLLSVGEVLINNISSSFNRTVDASYYTYDSGSYKYNLGGRWTSTNLITKISLIGSVNLKAGSNIILMGCR